MKITPVFKYPAEPSWDDIRHTIPLWLIEDVEIPDSITKAISDPYSWSNYSKIFKDKNYAQGHKDRAVHKNSKELTQLLNKASGLEKDIVKFIMHQKDYDFRQSWPAEGVAPYLKKMGISYSMVKDGVQYRQHPHIDNHFVFGTVLINLRDNPKASGTVYYDYRDYLLKNTKETRIYKGPYKKGTGLLHINTPANLHEGWNEGDFDRYVAFGNLCLV